MSNSSKDSSEVAGFMALFARLKEWADDEPEGLIDFATNDESVRTLCVRLAWAAYTLKINERRARVLFAAPVDPRFLATWRDYEERYEAAVYRIWVLDFLPELSGKEPSSAPRATLAWDGADDDASEQAAGIEEAIHFARLNADQEDRWVDQPSFIEGIQEGVAAWERLKRETGFDLQGVFRRRALVPFVLVPRKVAAKHGSVEKLSMLKNLQQAHDAFVFGAPYAALALMRSVMEAVLRDHYRVEGKDLSERIRNARGLLPERANASALHALRVTANDILHLDPKEKRLTEMGEIRLEKEIVRFLYVLRELIEGVE